MSIPLVHIQFRIVRRLRRCTLPIFQVQTKPAIRIHSRPATLGSHYLKLVRQLYLLFEQPSETHIDSAQGLEAIDLVMTQLVNLCQTAEIGSVLVQAASEWDTIRWTQVVE